MYQCADTQRTAFGFGSFAPIAVQCSVYGFWSRAFIGFPCPKNKAGIRWDMTKTSKPNQKSFCLVITGNARSPHGLWQLLRNPALCDEINRKASQPMPSLV